MDRLLDKSAIRETLYTLAYAEDELDRSALMSLFIPNETFSLDLSHHLSTMPPQDLTPAELWDSANTHLAGFTATQHMLSNMLITFPDEDEELTKAHVKCQVHAYHCIQKEEGGKVESVTAHGIWEVDLEVWEGRWVCRKIVIRRDVPLDRPELYERAKERAGRGQDRRAKREA